MDFVSRKNSSVFRPRYLPNTPKSDGLVVFKVSQRWSQGLKSKRTERIVPYIDKRGLIHATAVCSWNCTAPQLFATILSTVFQRLSRNFRHYCYRDRPTPNDLFKVALVYTITNDDYWFLRSLEIFKRSRPILSHLYRKIKQLDAENKVLYDQAFCNALWFQSRVHFVNRVSCPYNTVVFRDRRTQFLPFMACRSPVTDYSINKMIKDWGSVYTPSFQ